MIKQNLKTIFDYEMDEQIHDITAIITIYLSLYLYCQQKWIRNYYNSSNGNRNNFYVIIVQRFISYHSNETKNEKI